MPRVTDKDPLEGLTHTERTSVFEKHRAKVWPHRLRVTLSLTNIAGGVPSDPRVVDGWIGTKVRDKDEVQRDLVIRNILERGLIDSEADITNDDGEVDMELLEEAIKDVADLKHLNGFKRLPDEGTREKMAVENPARRAVEDGDAIEEQLYIEGRQVKAMLRENFNIKYPSTRWGPTRKGTKGFTAEHVFVEEDVLPLWDTDGNPVMKPTRVNQRFVRTRFGSGLQYEEIVEDCLVRFHVVTDHDFDDEEWASVFLSGEHNGLGATRSQGFGRFVTVEFSPVGYQDS